MIQKQKIVWKLIQFSLCSIFGSQHYDSWHFKDFKVITISRNAMRSSVIQSATHQTRKNNRYTAEATH